jgi:hypothetical protein
MKHLFAAIVLLLLGAMAQAQPIFIDQPVQTGDLIVFPHIKDSSKYYYLPNKIELGSDPRSGGPQFSFIRWVQNVKSDEENPNRREGEGGGIIHALVELKVTDAQIKRAESQLKDKVKRQDATIVGPVIFKDGKFTLVSSVMDENGGMAKKVIGLGKAPVFVGNKAAVSVTLTKLGAKILWESCQTPTPDLSFSFQMDMSGYRSPIQAKIEVDWDKMYSHEGWNLGVGVNTGYVGLGVDIKSSFDKLREEGVIKVTNFGADDKMEAAIDAAYKKILDMMFAPFSMPDDPNNSTVNQILDGANKVANAVKQYSSIVSVNFAYEMKKQQKTGKYVIDLSKSTIETFSFRFDENVGSGVASCKKCFKQINLDDPLYRQREILVSVDGLNADQFSKYVNFATVQLRKVHGGGQLSTDEIRIGPKELVERANVFPLLYGWKDASDANRDNFLKYDYKVQWSFFGNHTVEQDWRNSDQLGINVGPPFHPVQVSVEADPKLMTDQGIRVAAVKFFYDYGAGEKVESVTIRASDQITAQIAEFMLKTDRYDYEYEVVWRLMGNKSMSSGRRKASETLLYVDEIPADAIEVK